MFATVAERREDGALGSHRQVRRRRPSSSSSRWARAVIVEKAFVEQAGQDYGTGTNIMGSGPYKLVSWTSGANIELEANADYWDPNLKPKVQAVTLEFLTDTGTINSALMSGEIDGLYEVPMATIPALREATYGKLYYGPSLITTAIVPVNPDSPIGNANIRKALSLAIDRQEIVDKVYYGAAMINKTITPPTAWDADPAAHKIYEAGLRRDPGRQTRHRGREGTGGGRDAAPTSR